MLRRVLIAAVAAVAGAHDAAAAVASAPTAAGEVSWAEARCMLRKRRIAFLGGGALEYIVVAKLPRALAEVRALA